VERAEESSATTWLTVTASIAVRRASDQ
jgi:hypothetical protein